MNYLVIYSSEFHELKVRKFSSFNEATELAEDYFEKGYSVEIIRVAQTFIPRATRAVFEEVV